MANLEALLNRRRPAVKRPAAVVQCDSDSEDGLESLLDADVAGHSHDLSETPVSFILIHMSRSYGMNG